jgi:Spirocyclase AveC-like
MATGTITAVQRRETAAAEAAALEVVPVRYWAFAGALIVAFILYALISWVSGPFFHQVKPGPTPEPGWMKVSLVVWQSALGVLWLGMLWWWVVRPWRRERTVTTEGLFTIAGMTLFFQDPLSDYFNVWVTYNAHLVNWGSWVHEIPGWMAYGAPGHDVVEPPLFVPFCHGTAWIIFCLIGSWMIRVARRQFPRMGVGGLFAVVWGGMFVMDLIVEGLLYVPFGIFTFAGGHSPNLFPQSYHKFPLHEALFVGLWSTVLVFLFHFRDDRGMTFVERGADRVRGGVLKRAGLRLLALIAALQVGFFVVYMVPTIAFFASKSTAWPRDLQNRSYLLDGLCGQGTAFACPGPGVPLNRGDGESETGLRVGPAGGVSVPRGWERPQLVPFSRKAGKTFVGPLIG